MVPRPPPPPPTNQLLNSESEKSSLSTMYGLTSASFLRQTACCRSAPGPSLLQELKILLKDVCTHNSNLHAPSVTSAGNIAHLQGSFVCRSPSSLNRMPVAMADLHSKILDAPGLIFKRFLVKSGQLIGWRPTHLGLPPPPVSEIQDPPLCACQSSPDLANMPFKFINLPLQSVGSLQECRSCPAGSRTPAGM